MVRLEEYRSTIIGKLSKGYRQRVGLAQAILHEPEVLILDEPTIGIDPIQVVETREVIRDLGREHTILLSTHILAEVSLLCQRVLIIHDGSLVAEDAPDQLARRLRGTERLELEVRGPAEEVTTAPAQRARRDQRATHRIGRPPRVHHRRPARRRPDGRRGPPHRPARLGTLATKPHGHEPGGDLPPVDHGRGGSLARGQHTDHRLEGDQDLLLVSHGLRDSRRLPGPDRIPLRTERERALRRGEHSRLDPGLDAAVHAVVAGADDAAAGGGAEAGHAGTAADLPGA